MSAYCGTTTGYAYGCRCSDCKRAHREAKRVYNASDKPRRWLGPVRRVDVSRLTNAIISDGRPRYKLSVDCGLSPSTIDTLLSRGTATESVIDSVACQLGMHMSEVII